MESVVCCPEPLGCFALPSGGGTSSSVQDNSEGEDYADEFILSDETLAAALRAQDPPGCFMCIADTLGAEE
jgi:hypothetical protein